MDLNMIMNMHVAFDHGINFKLTKTNMHATIKLQSHMLSLKHDLVHKFTMKHARTSSMTTIRRWVPYLEFQLQGEEANLWNLHSKSSSFLAKTQEQAKLSLSLSNSLLGRFRDIKWLRESVCLRYINAQTWYTRPTNNGKTVITSNSLISSF